MSNETKPNQIFLSLIGVTILIVTVVGISFAAFNTTDISATNTVTTGTILMSYTQPSNNLTIANANPTSSSTAYASANHFDFTISATTSAILTLPYTITITPTITGENLSTVVRVGLKKGGVIVNESGYNYTSGIAPSALAVGTGTRASSRVLYTGSLTTSLSGASYQASTAFQVFLWINSGYQLSGTAGTYSIVVNVDANAAPLS